MNKAVLNGDKKYNLDESTHGVNVMVGQTVAYSFIICIRIQNIIRHNISSNCIGCKVPISE